MRCVARLQLLPSRGIQQQGYLRAGRGRGGQCGGRKGGQGGAAKAAASTVPGAKASTRVEAHAEVVAATKAGQRRGRCNGAAEAAVLANAAIPAKAAAHSKVSTKMVTLRLPRWLTSPRRGLAAARAKMVGRGSARCHDGRARQARKSGISLTSIRSRRFH